MKRTVGNLKSDSKDNLIDTEPWSREHYGNGQGILSLLQIIKDFNKEEMKGWLVGENVNFPEDSLKKEFLSELDKYTTYSRHIVEGKAKELGITVIGYLQPRRIRSYWIFLEWSEATCGSLRYNVWTKFVVELMNRILVAVASEQWKNYYKHVEKIEDTMWEADNLHVDIEPWQIMHLVKNPSVEISNVSEDDSTLKSRVMSGCGSTPVGISVKGPLDCFIHGI